MDGGMSIGDLPAGAKVLDVAFHGTTLVITTSKGVYAARAGEKLKKLEPSRNPVFTEVRHGCL